MSSSDGYQPFSQMAGGHAPPPQHQPQRQPMPAAPPDLGAAPPQPRMRPAPAGYGEPQQAYQPQPAPHAQPVRTEVAPAAVNAQPPTATATAALAAATGQPTSAPADEDPNLVVLSKPYPAFDLIVTRVRLRKPVARDVKKCGYPLRPVFAEDGGSLKGYDILPDVIVKYIPLLSDPPLPPNTVDQLEISDLNAFSTVINRFFQE